MTKIVYKNLKIIIKTFFKKEINWFSLLKNKNPNFNQKRKKLAVN